MNNEIKSKADILGVGKKQLSLDLACSPEQFDSYENTIVTTQIIQGRRRFRAEKDFFHMATFGRGTVISVDEKLTDWCQQHMKNHEGIRLFEHDAMVAIEKEMNKYGKRLFGVCEYYLPIPNFNRRRDIDSSITIKWYEREEIPQLYLDKRFRNALLYDERSLRPDVLAVAAVMDGQMGAMAGASMDSDLFWQIGIDVMPEFRNKGLATYLVSALTDEILARGYVPYYGTWSANIASRSVAAGSGYFPAWVETDAVDR